MILIGKVRGCIAAVLVSFALVGCVTDIDPTRPEPNTGYVDFVTQKCNIKWSIFDENGKKMGQHDIKESIIRFAKPPGSHHFSVVVMRHDTGSGFGVQDSHPSKLRRETADINVSVMEGMVSSVVECPQEGTVPLKFSKIIDARPERMTYMTETVPGPAYAISATVHTIRPFAPKREMHYFNR